MFSNHRASHVLKHCRDEDLFVDGSELYKHNDKYQASCKKCDKKDKDMELIAKTTERLKRYPIKCFRYGN